METVAYHLLPSMLLNEMQKRVGKMQRKDARIVALQIQLFAQQGRSTLYGGRLARIDMLTARLNALEDQARAARPERLATATRWQPEPSAASVTKAGKNRVAKKLPRLSEKIWSCSVTSAKPWPAKTRWSCTNQSALFK